MDDRIYLIIAVTFFGFIALAFVLLFPVWRFLRRQERLADDWTPDALARRFAARDGAASDGTARDGTDDDPEPPAAPPAA